MELSLNERVERVGLFICLGLALTARMGQCSASIPFPDEGTEELAHIKSR